MKDFCLSPVDIHDATWYKYQNKVSRLNRPVVIAWGLTNACDLHCIHCAVEAGKPAENELSTEEALRAIDNMVEARTRHLLMAGGEPLVRKDIFTLAEYASKKLSVGINTNGFSLNTDVAQRLRDAGVNQIASTLANQQPIKAYVVGKEVSTQQSLDRNIVKNATLG